jgi:hypothetical protein
MAMTELTAADGKPLLHPDMTLGDAYRIMVRRREELLLEVARLEGKLEGVREIIALLTAEELRNARRPMVGIQRAG